MEKPLVRIYPTMPTMSLAAALLFTEHMDEAVKKRGRAQVALSGGSTPSTLFNLLAQSPYKENIPWERIHFYWADERCVPPEDSESNYGQVWQSLLSKVPVLISNIHRIKGELQPEAAAQDYRNQLKQNAAQGLAWPVLDSVWLGMGADGHIASLFPEQANPAETRQPAISVVADYMGRPANRVTLTPLVFNSALHIVFMVSGENKSKALSEVLDGAYDPIHWPAQRVKPAYGDITWIVDEGAASARPH